LQASTDADSAVRRGSRAEFVSGHRRFRHRADGAGGSGSMCLPPFGVPWPLVLIWLGQFRRFSTLPTMWKVLDFQAWPGPFVGRRAGPACRSGALCWSRAPTRKFFSKLKASAPCCWCSRPRCFFIRKPMAFGFLGRQRRADRGRSDLPAAIPRRPCRFYSGPLPNLVGERARLDQGPAPRRVPDFHGTVLGAAPAGADRQPASSRRKYSGLALLALPRHTGRRTDSATPRLSGAERPQFLRRRARSAVFLSGAFGLVWEQHRRALGQRFHVSNHIRQPRRACRTKYVMTGLYG